MDWSKIKTIFILAFSILNIFLYLLYLNRYNEAQDLQPLGETSIMQRLTAENILVPNISENAVEEAYMSGRIQVFNPDELKVPENQSISVVGDTKLVGTFIEPVAIDDVDEETLSQFVHANMINGKSYRLWHVDEDEGHAIFFQTMNDQLIFYNQNARIDLYWDSEGKINRYEQTAFTDLMKYDEKESLLSEKSAVTALYAQGKLNPNSKITSISLGYSTLVQFTETQVFAPTWRVRVELQDGSIENLFLNAVEGKIIDFESNAADDAVK